jgi:hypothetical protein
MSAFRNTLPLKYGVREEQARREEKFAFAVKATKMSDGRQGRAGSEVSRRETNS